MSDWFFLRRDTLKRHKLLMYKSNELECPSLFTDNVNLNCDQFHYGIPSPSIFDDYFFALKEK